MPCVCGGEDNGEFVRDSSVLPSHKGAHHPQDGQHTGMGNQCCTERKVESSGPKKTIGGGGYNDKAGRHISVGYHSKGDDAEKFDKAFEKNDIPAFIALLGSRQKIEHFEERMHPWAKDPQTVGALAGTQLAILASMAEKDNPAVKDAIRDAGGIPPLVNFLRSEEDDRVQTAVVCLSFLSAENRENCVHMYKAGILPLLLPHLNSKVDGMRAATASTLRNIFVEGEEYRKEFVDLGGIKGLIRQLEWNPPKAGDPPPNLDMQLEAVLNLQDLIEDDHGNVIQAYATAATQAGAPDLLKKLLKCEDLEVQNAVKDVLTALGAH